MLTSVDFLGNIKIVTDLEELRLFLTKLNFS